MAVNVTTKQVVCPNCNGSGALRPYEPTDDVRIDVECDLCDGTGRASASLVTLQNGHQSTCLHCGEQIYWRVRSDPIQGGEVSMWVHFSNQRKGCDFIATPKTKVE